FQGLSTIATSTAETCGLRSSRKSISSFANSSMQSARELRASEYTVFFIVSVGRILLLSPSVKHVSKSPSSSTCTDHSCSSCLLGPRFTRITRTRDFPYLFSASLIIRSTSSIGRVPVRTEEQWNVIVQLPISHVKCNFDLRV